MTTTNSASVTPCRPGRVLHLALCAAAMLLAGMVQADTVEVHGRASAFVEPDRFTIQLGVERTASTSRDAYEALETAVRAVYLALAEAGIDTALSVRTQHLRLWSERRSQDREHRASSVVQIERRIDSEDPQSTTRFLSAALGAGASSFQGLSFDTDPQLIEETTTRLMPEAVRAARTRAQSLASAESRAVGRLVRIVESGVAHRPPVLERPMSASTARSPADRGIPVHSGAGLVVTVEAIFELE